MAGEYERIPDWDNDEIPDNNDDDDNADQTGAFVPNGASTPAPEFQTQQNEKGGFPELPKVPEDLLTELPSLSTTTFTAEGEIYKEFPNADKNKIKYMIDGKGRLRVGLISPKKPYYNLLTQFPGKSGEYRVNPQLPKEVLRALGESRRQTIEKEITRLSEGIFENKKIADDSTKDPAERKRGYERLQRQISSRTDLQRELDQLKAGEYTRDGGGQSIPLEVFQKKRRKKARKRRETTTGKKRKRKSHK